MVLRDKNLAALGGGRWLEDPSPYFPLLRNKPVSPAEQPKLSQAHSGRRCRSQRYAFGRLVSLHDLVYRLWLLFTASSFTKNWAPSSGSPAQCRARRRTDWQGIEHLDWVNFRFLSNSIHGGPCRSGSVGHQLLLGPCWRSDADRHAIVAGRTFSR
jgi:hypothetical protein